MDDGPIEPGERVRLKFAPTYIPVSENQFEVVRRLKETTDSGPVYAIRQVSTGHLRREPRGCLERDGSRHPPVRAGEIRAPDEAGPQRKRDRGD